MKTRLPILTLAVAIAAVAIQSIPGAAAALQFDRSVPLGLAPWRLWTAHLAHFDPNHLGWDVGTFVALGWFCEPGSRGRCAVTLALAAAAIIAAVWIGQPQFQCYRGLSGLDCAWFGHCAGRLLRRPSAAARFTGALGLLGALLKCTFELVTGSTLFASADGYAPVPLAHLVGLLVGTLVATWRVRGGRGGNAPSQTGCHFRKSAGLIPTYAAAISTVRSEITLRQPASVR